MMEEEALWTHTLVCGPQNLLTVYPESFKEKISADFVKLWKLMSPHNGSLQLWESPALTKLYKIMP